MRSTVFGSLFVLVAIALGACDETIAPTPLVTADAGAVANDGSVASVACTTSPHDDASVVVDACGVFVAPAGDDGAAGTKDAPVRTITKALALARAASKQVFVCGDASVVYREPSTLRLDTSDARRGLFGGFACGTWKVDATQRPSVRVPARPTPDPVLRADGASDVRIEDLAFASEDATDPGTSSIALQFANARVALRRVGLAPGRGAAGAPGTPAPARAAPASKGNDGASGGAAIACTCPDGATTGGAGGTAGVSGGDGAAGAPASTASGAGGTYGTVCAAGGDGHDGAAGAAGTAGLHAYRHGELTADGWITRRGESGTPGARGQGGGGGAAGTTGVGGGGGCGGCGGAPGEAGQGGGSSIAIAAFETELDVTSSLIVLGRGGDGGDGAAGQLGQPGGAGGAPSAVACSGGVGGAGGAGGAGGGGSGGHSVAVLYKGIIPSLDSPSSSSTELGVPGKGGTRGGDASDRAPNGVAAAVWISD